MDRWRASFALTVTHVCSNLDEHGAPGAAVLSHKRTLMHLEWRQIENHRNS